MTLRRVLTYCWAFPNTLLGLVLALAALVSGGRVRRVEGVLEVEGGLVSWLLRRAVPLRGGALAITIGHVVLGRDAAALRRSRAHERVHVRQYEVWRPLFIPAYVIAGLAVYARGGHPYWDNPFEREARLHAKSPHGSSPHSV